MVKEWIAGLAAIVLGCGVHEVEQQAQPTVETIVITDEYIKQYYAEKHKKAEDLYSVGVALYEAKSYYSAIGYFRQALAKNRKLTKALDKMAECYMLRGDYNAAEAYAEDAVKREPGNELFKATLRLIQSEKEEIRRRIQAGEII